MTVVVVLVVVVVMVVMVVEAEHKEMLGCDEATRTRM